MCRTSLWVPSLLAVFIAVLWLHSSPVPVAAAQHGEELPEPQAVDFVTDDGVVVAGTYFPSALGKESPVAMLLHALGRRQRDYDSLAFQLQDQGFAVVTFDFRGHGYSTRLDAASLPLAQAGAARAVRLDWRNLRTSDALRSLTGDIEAAKRFVLDRHNAGELNASKLVLVGAELGATLAAEWTLYDWSRPVQGFYGRQGQDVRALVLLSPEVNFRGMQMHEAVSELAARVPMAFAASTKSNNAVSDAERLYAIAGREAPDGTHMLQRIDSPGQRTKLLAPAFKLDEAIVQFLRQSVRHAPRWTNRDQSE